MLSMSPNTLYPQLFFHIVPFKYAEIPDPESDLLSFMEFSEAKTVGDGPNQRPAGTDPAIRHITEVVHTFKDAGYRRKGGVIFFL